ncbi:MAG TPA: beta-ketoacyl synthase N-terminal-like domain-containing protein [Mycobacteriales bacterium]|nr:beta-ketoacyl synthase N-terminal-like domain-containing protein [Mycobacteriales bacterium]
MEPTQLRQVIEEQLTLSRTLKARIRELEAAARAPLAVVGMALRLPGGLTTPEAYWTFLNSDATALSEIPADRPGLAAVYDPRPDVPGRSYVDRAGFLADVAGFDAGFFGISQREAEALDPQQRLLLETSWEALERAGVAVRRGDRLPAGVFVGIMASEYGDRLATAHDKTGIDPYYGTGGGHCFAAGRVSYALGLSGPALAVDTACSSSLAALHLGAASLRRGECRYALVGGSNLIFSPDLMVSLCQSKALSPEGRSKAFAATADGYGRGEGVGMLVLMRLADAEAEGRPVLAVLRGTAVNHDGASSGLTVPSGPAQQEVVRAALADAGVAPADVGYVEAHGTGTALGDPIEAGALDAVAGTGAPDRPAPLAIGSVKAKIGHLEAAAGIAGLIKLVLMLRHGTIPPSLSPADGELNPLIAWDQVRLTVPRRSQPWPAAYGRRVAGISAFGLSGTNAHAVLEAAPVAGNDGPPGTAPRRELVTLSARDGAALAELAAAVADRLDRLDPARLAAVCHTLRAGRAPFGHRVAVTGSTPAELAHALRTAVDGGAADVVAVPVRALSLRVGPITEPITGPITAALDALVAAYPGLAPLLAGAAPQTRLERLLRALGVRVQVTDDGSLTGSGAAAAATLTVADRALPLITGDPAATPRLLVGALAAAYTAGVDLRLDALAAPGTRFVADLPTYPFRRRRFWIDEPLTAPPSAGGAAPAALSVLAGGGQPAGSQPAEGSGCALTQENVERFLLAELAAVLKAEGELDRTASFLDVGGDSFTAMLLMRGIEQQFQIEVPAEELVNDMPLAELLGKLGAHILGALGERQEQSA